MRGLLPYGAAFFIDQAKKIIYDIISDLKKEKL